ncbi:Uncharacterised protein [uncultured Ruminococcus sp.]|nr:Uncharacterised protein [uncultured Clostridium sp.]SCH60968.1 Uncharacterised protein [uncultured Ruminococcus sp.]
MNNRLLEYLKKEHRVSLSAIRSQSEHKWVVLGDLYRLQNKEQYPLKEWEEAVSYLLGCTVQFANYQEIETSLKPFSLEVK